MSAGLETLREIVTQVHATKVALTKACFLDEDVRRLIGDHPGWPAWSQAYSSLFDIDTRLSGEDVGEEPGRN